MTFGAGGQGDVQPDARAGGVRPAADYDRFVDWPKRLAREEPFFRRVFAEHGVRRVIDVGTGSGMPAIAWAGWGLDVVGVDPDAAMLAQAEANRIEASERVAAVGGSIRFLTGAFGDLGGLGLGVADAVTCTGNALPHVAGQAALLPALRDFAAVLRPGGVLVLHLLNHDRLLAGKVRAIPPKVRDDADGTWVYLRVMDYVEGGIAFDFITLHRPVGESAWETESRRSVHTAIPSALLVATLEEAGFCDVALFGNHDGAPFDAARDESVIVTAVRA